MKKLLLIPLILLFANCTKSQIAVKGANIVVQLPAYIPVTSGLTADFDFSKTLSVTQVSGKVSQIVDAKSGIVSSQSNATLRPVYTVATPSYATFSGSTYTTGALVQPDTAFTMIVIRRVSNSAGSNSGIASFQNGYVNNGYALENMNQGGTSCLYPGVYTLGNSLMFTGQGFWEVDVSSHSPNSNKLYNGAATPFPVVQTVHPSVPTTSHYIGYSQGANGYIGDILRIIVYKRQLSDAEVLSDTYYLCTLYGLPIPALYNAGGDSITYGAGGITESQGYPVYAVTGLLPNSHYLSLQVSAVPGRNSANVLANINSEVISTYQSNIPCVYSLMIGHNDFAGGIPADTLYAHTASIISAVKTAHPQHKVILCTTLYTTSYAYSVTDTYNNRLRANWKSMGADTLFDMNQVTNMTDPTNTTYYNGGVHPTAAGEALIAAAIQPILTAILKI